MSDDFLKRFQNSDIDSDKDLQPVRDTVESEMSNVPPAVQEFQHKLE